MGGIGSNTLNGGAGGDAISSDGTADLINGGAGIDKLTVYSYNSKVDLTIDISMGGGGADIGNGTRIWNIEALIFIGGSGNDTVTGGALQDGLNGGLGDDFLSGGGGDDLLAGGAGSNVLNAGAGNDRIYSSGTSDLIDGGTGTDELIFDFSDSNVGLTIDISAGGGGADIGNGTKIWNVEALRFDGGSGNDTVTGGALRDELFGGQGNDILNGGGGIDELFGSSGNDTLNGGGGNDELSGSYGNDTLNGGAGNDSLYDHSGNNTLNGGGGDDWIVSYGHLDRIDGGTGTDFLNIHRDNTDIDLTVDISAGGGGADIGDGTQIWNVEILHFEGGSGNDTVTGGALGDFLVGFDGDDALNGGAGKDSLWGVDGNDILNGGSGIDWLWGGAGLDILIGGGGVDTFVFAAIADSAVGAGRDLISDFDQGIDKINVSGIDAITGGVDEAFSFIGGADFSGAAGELRFFQTASGNTIVEADTNGDGVADFQIACTGIIDFTAGDFVL